MLPAANLYAVQGYILFVLIIPQFIPYHSLLLMTKGSTIGSMQSSTSRGRHQTVNLSSKRLLIFIVLAFEDYKYASGFLILIKSYDKERCGSGITFSLDKVMQSMRGKERELILFAFGFFLARDTACLAEW